MVNLYCIRPKGFNIGNDVIFLALSHFLRSAFKETVNLISLPATSKYESHKKAGLNPQTVYEVNQYGDGLIIGGGNLYENGELEINPSALKALEVPLMLFSLSRGGIYNKRLKLTDRTDVMSDERIVMLNRKARISLTRDLATKGHLDDLGCANRLCGCPTLFLGEVPHHLVFVPEKDRTDALISVRSPALMSIPIEHQFRVRSEIADIIARLKAHGYRRIKLLCHDHRDIPFAASFADMEYLYAEDVHAFLSFLKSTRLSVTYRLHAFLPCLAFGIPAINISYDQRASSLVKTIGLDEWNINMLHADAAEEVALRMGSLERLARLRARCEKTVWKRLREAITGNLREFAKRVGEGQR
ncbi:MAG: polysaccharide pyruvyl transferase family protein [Elusimicrobia bacterium]|nr:polysaccharide pyruvyl transferase family protein [Elusimicrobiota bacterium]